MKPKSTELLVRDKRYSVALLRDRVEAGDFRLCPERPDWEKKYRQGLRKKLRVAEAHLAMLEERLTHERAVEVAETTAWRQERRLHLMERGF